jgi:hypothetical protein
MKDEWLLSVKKRYKYSFTVKHSSVGYYELLGAISTEIGSYARAFSLNDVEIYNWTVFSDGQTHFCFLDESDAIKYRLMSP